MIHGSLSSLTDFNKIKFDYIEIGRPFMVDRSMYLKIQDVKYNIGDDEPILVCGNAVGLSTGKIEYFETDKPVGLISAEVIVRSK
jgi:hypothetical protein